MLGLLLTEVRGHRLPGPFAGLPVRESCPCPLPARVGPGSGAGRFCGYLPACRCLIPGKRAHTQTQSLRLNFQMPASAAQRAFCSFKPTPPGLRFCCETGTPGSPCFPSPAGSFLWEARGGRPGPPDPHPLPSAPPQEEEGQPGGSRLRDGRVPFLPLLQPHLPTGLASGKSQLKSFQSKSTF